jgi:hypothetical protein
MAWPSGTKAATTNVDAGTDQPKLARADIKQNIDNVNSIIDELNIASPSDGDLMQYSSSSERWEPVASSSVGGSTTEIAFARIINSVGENVSGNIYRRYVALYEDVDWITQTGAMSTGIASRGGNGSSFSQMTLDAGTYVFQIMTTSNAANDGETTHLIYNETDSENINTSFGGYNEIGSTTDGTYQGTVRFTLAAQKTISVRIEQIDTTKRDVFFDFNIYKTA